LRGDTVTHGSAGEAAAATPGASAPPASAATRSASGAANLPESTAIDLLQDPKRSPRVALCGGRSLQLRVQRIALHDRPDALQQLLAALLKLRAEGHTDDLADLEEVLASEPARGQRR
jgi:hypothetical protein